MYNANMTAVGAVRKADGIILHKRLSIRGINAHKKRGDALNISLSQETITHKGGDCYSRGNRWN